MPGIQYGNLPAATLPLSGAELVSFDQGGETVLGPASAVAQTIFAGLASASIPLTGTELIPLQQGGMLVYATQKSVLAIPPTAAEAYAIANLGVTIANYAMPPYSYDRYGLNTAPGTTHMASAAQMAVSCAFSNIIPGVTEEFGGVVITYGQTGTYYLESSINCCWAASPSTEGATSPGIIMRNVGRRSRGYNTTADTSGGVLIFAHAGIGFDCIGNSNMLFVDLSATSLASGGVYPLCAVRWARNHWADGVQNGLVRPQVLGQFTNCLVYNFGSEGNFITDGYMGNSYPGACSVLTYSANNLNNTSAWNAPANDAAGNQLVGLPSGSLGFASPPQSTTVHDVTNMQLANLGGNIGSDVVRLDGIQGYKHRGGWTDNHGGRCIWYFDQSSASGSQNIGQSTDIQISGVRLENSGTPVFFGLLFGTAAIGTVAAPNGVRVRDCFFNTNNIGQAISSLAWAGGVATVTTTAAIPVLPVGATFFTAIAGVTMTNPSPPPTTIPSPYVGTYLATITGTNTFTFALTSNPGAYVSPGTYTAPAATIATMDANTTLANLTYDGNNESATHGINLRGNLTVANINNQSIIKIDGVLSRASLTGTPANWYIGAVDTNNTNVFASIGGKSVDSPGIAISATSVTVNVPSQSQLPGPSTQFPSGYALSYAITITPQAQPPGLMWVDQTNMPASFAIHTASAVSGSILKVNYRMDIL